jgi:hypothetical protein
VKPLCRPDLGYKNSIDDILFKAAAQLQEFHLNKDLLKKLKI